MTKYKKCFEGTLDCYTWATPVVVTLHYSIFLGIYGILTAAAGIVALYLEKIPLIAPLVADTFGALFYLSGGVAWLVASSRPELYGYWYDVPTAEARGAEGLVWTLFAFTACLAICSFLRRRDNVQSFK